MHIMPVPSPSCLFDTGLRNTSSPSEGMKSITQRQLNLFSKRFKMNTPPSTSDSEDVVGDLGEYFTGTAAMWARLTHQLINGPHINEAAVKACERSKALSHMSDLGEIAKIDVDLSILRQICDLSETFARQVQDIWQPQTSLANRGGQEVMPTYISWSCDTNMSSVSEAMSLNSEGDSTHFGSRKLLPDQSQMSHASLKCGDMSGLEDSSDDDEQFASIDMEALRQRGRGLYLCPKGLKCDKGGVDKDGNLVVFDWNSSFAQHCNKHRKPWRCDVPGCPNPPKKRKFARRDGLERHKTTVKHYLVTLVETQGGNPRGNQQQADKYIPGI